MTEKEVVSLKEFLEARIASIEDLSNTRFKSLEKSTELASNELKDRLRSMNEVRQQLKDQAATFITRSEHEAFGKEIESLKLSRAELRGKADQKSVNITLILSSLGFIIAIISIILGFFGR